jgi:hypothetical protein
VQGTPGKPQNTANTTAELEGHLFTWSIEDEKPLRVGESALVKINVRGPDGQPFKQLEPVMGAYAHMVAFPTNLESVTHVHPTGPEPTTKSERGGPDLSFHVVPEQAGLPEVLPPNADRRARQVRGVWGGCSASLSGDGKGGRGRHLHLPDAPRSAAERPGQMLEVRRHGASAREEAGRQGT